MGCSSECKGNQASCILLDNAPGGRAWQRLKECGDTALGTGGCRGQVGPRGRWVPGAGGCRAWALRAAWAHRVAAVLVHHHAVGKGLIVRFDEERPLLPVQDVCLHEDHVLNTCDLQGKGRGGGGGWAAWSTQEWRASPAGLPQSPPALSPRSLAPPPTQPGPRTPTPDFRPVANPSSPPSSGLAPANPAQFPLLPSPAFQPSPLLGPGSLTRVPPPSSWNLHPNINSHAAAPSPGPRRPGPQLPRPALPHPRNRSPPPPPSPRAAHLPQQPRGVHAQPAAPLHHVHSPVRAAGLAQDLAAQEDWDLWARGETLLVGLGAERQ